MIFWLLFRIFSPIYLEKEIYEFISEILILLRKNFWILSRKRHFFLIPIYLEKVFPFNLQGFLYNFYLKNMIFQFSIENTLRILFKTK